MSNYDKRLSLILVLLLISVLTASCAEQSSPADAVERYLQAIVEKDVVAAANQACLAWEEDAYAEASSFETVEVRLEGLDCEVVAEEGEYQRVSCEGEIVANYGGEDQDIPLDQRDFYVVEEGGQWRMCGYSAPLE
ncbi:MAG: hypothetical protein PVI81_01965 [Anaerolineales bacterium]|jgi:hypothetical protein